MSLVMKCRMCGGNVVFEQGDTYGTCDSCGSTVAIPKVSDEARLNLFNRADAFRRRSDFDKAVDAYEKILDEDDTDAEAHWGFLLSRYGIEYVEDPSSHERIPTCHRVQPDSILDDPDYLAALDHAPDPYVKSLYETEAKRIAQIQKDILSISNKEAPYDVFICYKETGDDGSRTKDSVLAQEIYYGLTEEKYKVFFSRITLEDKLGTQYEPYIFAALHSAKVMLVVGTKPEYFNAVWVRNEWSRFLALKEKDPSKVVIPCYRDMDPYDLPEELSVYQSQDMAKIGFMQDLLHGIEKLLHQEPMRSPYHTEAKALDSDRKISPSIDALYERALLFCEDGDFKKASAYADRILDIKPRYAPAYMLKVMSRFGASTEKAVVTRTNETLLQEDKDYQKAVRFSDGEVHDRYERLVSETKAYRLETTYQKGVKLQSEADHTPYETPTRAPCKELEGHPEYFTPESQKRCLYQSAIEELAKIPTFKDASQRLESCKRNADLADKEFAYLKAVALQDEADNTEPWEKRASLYQSAQDQFANIVSYKDASLRMETCTHNIKLANMEPGYQKAASYQNQADHAPLEKRKDLYNLAIRYYEPIKAFKNAARHIEECRNNIKLVDQETDYVHACEFVHTAKASSSFGARKYYYQKAADAFHALHGYKDSEERSRTCLDMVKEVQAEHRKAFVHIQILIWATVVAAFVIIRCLGAVWK